MGDDVEVAERPVPAIDDASRAFWTGGAAGSLLIQRCASCRRWQHPPQPVCPACHGRELRAEPVSGRGTVWSVTTDRLHPTPSTIALVELVEQPGLVVLTSIVGCDDARIGMDVTVRFEPAGEAWIPVFAP